MGIWAASFLQQDSLKAEKKTQRKERLSSFYVILVFGVQFESIKKINLLLFNRSRERAIILPTSPFWYALLLIILFHKLNLCFIYEVIIVFRIHNYFFIITVENKIIYYNEYY